MIGDDIKEVLSEVGSSIVIFRDDGNISGEYVDVETNEQATKPFIMSFFKKSTFQYDTQAVSGDILEVETTQDKYLITTLNTEEFENSTITKQGVLYFCNTSGELTRSSGEIWNTATYRKELLWSTVRENCYSLFVNPEFRNKMVDDVSSLTQLEDNELFLPSSVCAKINDRYSPYSGECYKVEVVNRYRYIGVDVCRVSKDTR